MSETILLVVLFILSAFFSASETALTSLSHIRLSHLVERKLAGARIVKKLKERPSEFLSIILIGNNLVNIAAAALATSITIHYFIDRGWGGEAAAIGVATGIMTFLVLVFGEIVPKTVAIRNAERFSLFVAPLLYVLRWVLLPIAWVINQRRQLSFSFMAILGILLGFRCDLVHAEQAWERLEGAWTAVRDERSAGRLSSPGLGQHRLRASASADHVQRIAATPAPQRSRLVAREETRCA